MNTPVVHSGDTSDGYHTFNELYEHRTFLYLALVGAYPDLCWWSEWHHDGTRFDGFILVGMELPNGQISYHLQEKYGKYLEKLGTAHLEKAPAWDNHTPADVVKRLQDWLLSRMIPDYTG